MKKKIAILLVLLMLLLPVTAAAAEIQWEISEDELTLTYDGKEYYRYSLNPADLFMPEHIYIPEQSGIVKLGKDEYQVVQTNCTDEIVVLSEDMYWYGFHSYVYATQEGAAILDRFSKGEYATLLISDTFHSEMAELTKEQLATLDNLKPNKILDVTELAEVDCYEIIGMDETGTMGHIHGAVYADTHSWYYINYDALDNSYFSSDGSFSFRSGTVDAVKLEDDAAHMVAVLMSEMTTRDEEIEYEPGEVEFTPEAADADAVFWTLTVILGVILPAVPLTFGLVYALKGKCLYPKRWFLLVALSAAWMLVMGAIVLLIMG